MRSYSYPVQWFDVVVVGGNHVLHNNAAGNGAVTPPLQRNFGCEVPQSGLIRLLFPLLKISLFVLCIICNCSARLLEQVIPSIILLLIRGDSYQRHLFQFPLHSGTWLRPSCAESPRIIFRLIRNVDCAYVSFGTGRCKRALSLGIKHWYILLCRIRVQGVFHSQVFGRYRLAGSVWQHSFELQLHREINMHVVISCVRFLFPAAIIPPPTSADGARASTCPPMKEVVFKSCSFGAKSVKFEDKSSKFE